MSIRRMCTAVIAVSACVGAVLVGGQAAGSTRAIVIDRDTGAFAVAWSAKDRALYVAGNVPDSSGNVDIFVRRYSDGGRLIWQRLIQTPDPEFARGIAVDTTGAVVVAGWRETAAGDDVLVAKFTARGVQQWVRTYDDWKHGDDRANGVATDAKDNIWVAGRVPASTEGSSEVWWSRWTSAGVMAKEWTARTSIIGNAEAFSIATTPDRVVLTGSTWETVDQQVGTNQDAWLGAFSSNGATIWERTWGTPGIDDIARGVAVDRTGQVYVTGQIATAANGYDVFLRRYSSAGRLAWNRTFARPGDDIGRAIAVNPNGTRIVMAGELDTGTFNSDALVRSYTARGDVAWTQVITSSGMAPGTSTPDAALAVVVPDSAYIAGRMAPTTASLDAAWPWAAKRAMSQGSGLWSDVFAPLG